LFEFIIPGVDQVHVQFGGQQIITQRFGHAWVSGYFWGMLNQQPGAVAGAPATAVEIPAITLISARRASCSGLRGSKFEGEACVVMRRYVPVAKRTLSHL
jgi:hypothetical protein